MRRGVLVVLAFVGVAVVLFAVAAGLGFLFGNVWLAIGAMLLIASGVELVARKGSAADLSNGTAS